MNTKSIRYTTTQIYFLKKKYAAMPIRDIVPLFNKRFKLNKTYVQIQSTLKNHHITCGRKYGERFIPCRICSPEEIKFLKKAYTKYSVQKLTVIFNEQYNRNLKTSQLRQFFSNHGILSGRTGYFEKGHRPWNTETKGLMKRNSGTFCKGHISANTKPLGSERICSKDGFILIKVAEKNPHTGAPTRYKHKHVVIWERKHGPVPNGKVVAFKDGNKLNCVLENLMLISRAELLILNQKQYKSIPDQFKPSVLALSKVEAKIFSMEKKSR